MTGDRGHSPQGGGLQRGRPGADTEPGPLPGHEDAPDVWPEDATRDRFVGDWFLYQRRRGHRTSTDDQLTAWSAVRWWDAHRNAAPERYLDIGCGIGSVLLATAHALRPVASLGVEAQPQSVRMARRSIAELPDPPALNVRLGDLRALSRDADGAFPLITGSPPYIPAEAGVMAKDPQRRACRFEVRGGIEAYCAAAAELLTEAGTFHVVFQTVWDQRVLDAAAAAALHLHGRIDVQMRDDRPGPFLTVYAFGLEAPARVDRSELTIRRVDGSRTEAYDAVRARLGLGSQVPA